MSEMVKSKPRRRFGTLKARKNAKHFAVGVTIQGRRYEQTTDLLINEANRKKLEDRLDRWEEEYQSGDFIFADKFPDAPDEVKHEFAKLQGQVYLPGPDDVLVEEYATVWLKRQPNKKEHSSAIKRAIAEFAGKTFRQLNGVVLVDFFKNAKCSGGPAKGAPLGAQRKKNIFWTLCSMFDDAFEEYHWEGKIPNPCDYVRKKNRKGKLFGKRIVRPPRVLRFDEWERITQALQPWWVPVCELMLLTSMGPEEVCAVRRDGIGPDYLVLPGTKNEYRVRLFPMTQALKRVTTILAERSKSGYLVERPNGARVTAAKFIYRIWKKTLARAGVVHRGPNVLRHTFACWAIATGKHIDQLVAMMGHVDRTMIQRRYGRLVKGVMDGAKRIRAFFGEDFYPADAMNSLELEETVQDWLLTGENGGELWLGVLVDALSKPKS